ncbi:MAG: DUF4114 domain-containing protein [Bacteroidaceae bacterium]|nr:DUF4114 domain-containing protein [Bacteroidaceae bacterium]
MKRKHLYTFLVPVIAMMTLAACSDYDNGFTEKKLEYIKEFTNLYGDIDAEQDWNLAERASVKVTTGHLSEIKIYAAVKGQFSIVGDYPDITGEQELEFDMPEGTTAIMVTDGRVAIQTTPGGAANFTDSRTVYENTTGFVKVHKITDPNGENINNVDYPQYKYATATDITAMKQIVPEIGHRDNYTNLNKVAHDFSYMSTGKFVIYPQYWQTSAFNTLGVYYLDAQGVRQEVDIYSIKEGSDLMYENVTSESAQTVVSEEAEFNGWTIDNGADGGNFHRNTWSTEADPSGMKTPFIEYWRGTGNNLLNGNISKTISGLEPGSYAVYIDVRLFNESRTASPTGVTFSANDATLDFCTDGNKATYYEYNGEGQVTKTSAEVYYNNLYVECTVETDGQLKLNFNLNNVTGDWLAFKNLRVVKRGTWASTDGRGSFGNVVRGQGIVVDIPEGTRFGMYLRSTTDQSNLTFYSESELNSNPNVCGYAVSDDGLNQSGSVQLQQGVNPCYASTFHVGDQMYLGFEDWPNTYNQSDFDLNDLVLAFDGCTPTIINEDPKEAATWILACEDLGGSFDTDYNDIVLKIEHISGKEFATITPLAAGGTLASYIFFEDPTTNASEICLGEIHQLFGREPQRSGEYGPINVGVSRGSAGQSVTIPVGKDWTMAHYTSEDFSTASQYSKNGNQVNMGGFGIFVLPEHAEPLTGKIYSTNSAFGPASIIAAPGLGEAPMMVCIPYTYTSGEYTYVWAWPQELKTIDDGQGVGAYTKFHNWVNNHSQDGDWYKYPYINTVSELKWLTATQTEIPDPTFDKQSGALYTSWGQIVKPYGHYYGIDGWSGTTIDRTADIKTHYGAQFGVGLTSGATGTIKVKGWNNGGTEANYEFNSANNTINISNVNKTGTIRLTVSYSGDVNYEAQEISYTFTVTAAEYVRFTLGWSAASWMNGKLRLAEKDIDWSDNSKYPDNSPWNYLIRQYWEKVPSSESGYFLLYNLKEGKYLRIGDGNDLWNYYLSDDVDIQRSRFALDDQGRLYCRAHAGRYAGIDANKTTPEEGDIIIPGQDPTKNSNIATWTMETVTP